MVAWPPLEETRTSPADMSSFGGGHSGGKAHMCAFVLTVQVGRPLSGDVGSKCSDTGPWIYPLLHTRFGGGLQVAQPSGLLDHGALRLWGERSQRAPHGVGMQTARPRHSLAFPFLLQPFWHDMQ